MHFLINRICWQNILNRFHSAMQDEGSPFSPTTCHFYPVLYYTVQVAIGQCILLGAVQCYIRWDHCSSRLKITFLEEKIPGRFTLLPDGGDSKQGCHAVPSNKCGQGQFLNANKKVKDNFFLNSPRNWKGTLPKISQTKSSELMSFQIFTNNKLIAGNQVPVNRYAG